MLDTCTDLYLSLHRLEASLAFPGPELLPSEALCFARELLDECERNKEEDFLLDTDQGKWRVHRDCQVIDGVWYRLRRLPKTPPDLDNLPSPLPHPIKHYLMDKALISGGLVLILGGAGKGKTTTASAALVSRLKQYGGVAYTLEDPPEMPLHGWHGRGFCTQTEVRSDDPQGWHRAFRAALRSQPTDTPQMLFVGEIRDDLAAESMLRAASNGFLVLATGFASDLVSGLEVMMQRCSMPARGLLADMLRLVVFQSLESGCLQAGYLYSADGAGSVAARIRTGQINQLQDEIAFLAARDRHEFISGLKVPHLKE